MAQPRSIEERIRAKGVQAKAKLAEQEGGCFKDSGPSFINLEAAMAKRYWLMKSEPTSYSIDDLKTDKSTLWEGVRNYQARNFMTNEMKVGDEVLFYHSSVEPPAVVGIAEVSASAEPDPTQFDASDSHYDPKATPANPIWLCVRVKFKQKFVRPVPLPELREQKELKNMVLLRRGSRLSIQPVTEKEFKLVSKLGSRKAEGTKNVR